METTDPPERPLHGSDSEIVRVLNGMLAANVTITPRAVAKKHPSIRHASSITRHAVRSELLRQYQTRQREFRSWAEGCPSFLGRKSPLRWLTRTSALLIWKSRLNPSGVARCNDSRRA